MIKGKLNPTAFSGLKGEQLSLCPASSKKHSNVNNYFENSSKMHFLLNLLIENIWITLTQNKIL